MPMIARMHHRAEGHRRAEEGHRGLDQIAEAGIGADELGDHRADHA